MTLRVTTSAPSQALVSLTVVKDRLGITVSTYDAHLSALIDEASSAIAEYLGRPLSRQSYVETISGNERQRIAVSCWPVDRDSVTLTIDGTADTDFSVYDSKTGMLYREGAWPIGAGSDRWAETPEENIAVTYKAGWVLPDRIAALANASYVVGQWVRPAVAVGDLLMECTTAGATSTATEPTWPTSGGGTVTIGTAVFTARHASEVPAALASAAWQTVRNLNTQVPAGVNRIVSDGQEIGFSVTSQEFSVIPQGVLSLLSAFRYSA